MIRRSKREKFKTMGNVFDDFTNRTIFKLISEGHFDGLQSPVLIGKESNVFLGTKDNKYVIVKIYRLEACDFNRMFEYIIEDPRYSFLKGKKRKVIFAWVQREFRNLMKARESGVNVPTPITFSNNILVMEMIGNDEPAPRLKDQPPTNPKEFFEEVIDNMKKLYKGGLIHADLSPFNILNHNEKPVFIDFSQTSPTGLSRSQEFLERDVKNILNYFSRLGIDEDPEKIIKLIAGTSMGRKNKKKPSSML